MNLTDKTILNIFARSSGAFFLLTSSIVMARHFSKTDFGSFLQVMLIVNSVLMLGSFGLPQSIYYFYHRAIDRPHFLVRTLLLSLCVGFLGAAFVFGMRNLLPLWFNNSHLIQYLPIASAITFTRGASQFRGPILISGEKLVLNAVYTLICDTLFYGPTVLGPFFTQSLAVIFRLMFLATLIDILFFLAVSIWQIRNDRFAKSQEVLENVDLTSVRLWDQIKYAAPIGLSSYLGVIGRQIDQYLVSIFFAPSDYAVYSRGALRVPVLGDLQFIVNDLQMPRYVRNFSSGEINSFLNIFHRCIVKVAKIKYPAFCFLFATAPSLIEILYTRAYDAAIPVFRTYLIMLLTTVTVYGIVPRASGKTISITISVLIGIFTNIVLSLLLLPMLGALGAAIGTIMANTTAAVYLLLVSCNLLNVSFTNIFPWSQLGKLLMVSIIASVPLYFIHFFFRPETTPLGLVLIGVEIVIYVISWVGLMARYRLLDIEDTEVIYKWLRVDLKRWLPSLRDKC